MYASHHFFGSDSEVLVVDEWTDEQSFQAFFEEAGPRIEQIMGAAGVTSQPSIEFWRHLDVATTSADNRRVDVKSRDQLMLV